MYVGPLNYPNLIERVQLKAHRNAYDQRITEAQEQQLKRRLTKLCQVASHV